jgi:DNA invertase Pin-like site-specific DNA recombinase
MASNIPLEPKEPNGPLRVISLGRLSQPKETKEETLESLDAIRRENERLLDQLYPGPKEIRYLAEQVSGTIPERETIQILWELVATGEWDVIVAEDLSRIFRNPRFQLGFVQDAVDIGIRVICFADHLDTADEHWETLAACATLRHGLLIPDTRRRIRRTATDSFHKGGQVGRVRITHLRVSKDDAKSGKYGPVGLRIRRQSGVYRSRATDPSADGAGPLPACDRRLAQSLSNPCRRLREKRNVDAQVIPQHHRGPATSRNTPVSCASSSADL